MLSQQYYTPCATSSLYKLNLIPTFGSASYHLTTSPLPYHLPVATGLRLRLTVTFTSVLGRGWLSCVACVPHHHHQLHEEEGNGRTRKAVDGKRRLASRRTWNKLRSTSADKKRTSNCHPWPVERSFGSGPSARIGSILRQRPSTTGFVTTTNNKEESI